MSDELVERLREPWFTNGCERYQLDAADRIEQLERELSISRMAQVVMDNGVAEAERMQAQNMRLSGMCYNLTAERDRLRVGIEYILDGYGLAGPDYRFPYGEEEADWITDHLIAALKGESHE